MKSENIENTFIDPTSGKTFRRYKYFDREVIQDVETGWINAGKFVMDLWKAKITKKRFADFKGTEDFQLCIEYMNDHYPSEEIRVYNKGFGGEVHGTYVPFPVFQIIALWADKRHKMAFIDSLSYINDLANLKTISAYDELKNRNEELKKRLELLEKEKTDLITPVNPLISPSCIYALPINDEYFQLKYSATTLSSKVPSVKTIEMVNARIVLDKAKDYLQKQGVISSIGHKKAIKMEYINEVFSIIDDIKHNEISLFSESKEEFIQRELERINKLPNSPQVEGKRFELKHILVNESWIPWDLVPLSIRGPINEMRRDNGIDAVIIENNRISTIIQIKMHHNTYLRRNEIETFLNKCHQDRYRDVQKILVLHGCKLSQALRDEIQSQGINIEIN